MNYSNEQLAQIISEKEEEMCRRIAMNLHDSSIQRLTSLYYKLEFYENLLKRDMEGAISTFSEIKNDVTDAISELRDTIMDLQPMSLFDLGFDSAISKLAQSFESYCGMKVIYQNLDFVSNLDFNKQLSLYRIFQEAFTNACKHGKAKRVFVSTSVDEYRTISISDDGIGFSEIPSSIEMHKNGHGFGLEYMRNRVSILSGKFFIHSIPGEGTTVKVVFPAI